MESETAKKELDEFELALQEKLKLLQDCQTSQDIDSCLKCDKIIGCQTRDEYVKAVYMSMNKGVTGGFEF